MQPGSLSRRLNDLISILIVDQVRHARHFFAARVDGFQSTDMDFSPRGIGSEEVLPRTIWGVVTKPDSGSVPQFTACKFRKKLL